LPGNKANHHHTEKVAKETRLYSWVRETETHKSSIKSNTCAGSVLEKQKMVKSSNMDVHTTITHKKAGSAPHSWDREMEV